MGRLNLNNNNSNNNNNNNKLHGTRVRGARVPKRHYRVLKCHYRAP